MINFVQAEIMASWWSILGNFTGQVINRPSRSGFFPNTDLLSLSESTSCIKLPSDIVYSECPPWLSKDTTINVHRLRDNKYVGRVEVRYSCCG